MFHDVSFLYQIKKRVNHEFELKNSAQAEFLSSQIIICSRDIMMIDLSIYYKGVD